MNSLRSIYGLEYEDAAPQSGLVKWYNKLIDKSVDDLDAIDVAKMIRQNILREVAINRAIELFLIQPFDGEMQDGDLLALLASCGSELLKSNRIPALISMIQKLEVDLNSFDWDNESTKTLFINNLVALKKYFY